MLNWLKHLATKEDVQAVGAKVEKAYEQTKTNGHTLGKVWDKVGSTTNFIPGEVQRPLREMQRKEAQNFYEGAQSCIETITSFMLMLPLPHDEDLKVRFVVPKSVPVDVNGQAVNLTIFRDYPELIEGTGLYHFDCAPTFLFGNFWVEKGVPYFRPTSPIEANQVFVDFTKGVDDANAKEYISEHAIYQPEDHQDSPYFIMDLSYNEVEFNSMVDVGYHQEDYLIFCAQRLRELRELCNQRYQEYYNGTEKTA